MGKPKEAENPAIEKAVKDTITSTITAEVQKWVQGIVDWELQTKEIRELRPFVADLVRDALEDALKEKGDRDADDRRRSSSDDSSSPNDD